jgi:hypothetical protein
MLRKLSREVSDCYAQADDCARKATEAVTEQSRNDYLRAQQSWLTFAHSYEFAERLLDFSNENKRRRAEFYGDDVATKCPPLAPEPTEPLQKQPRTRIKTPERTAVATEAIEVPEREDASYEPMTTSKSIMGVAPSRRLGQLFRRTLEAAAAATMLLCLAPILLITSVAIRLDSGGPVLIRETRSDCTNRAIQVFKFRFVVANAGNDFSSRRLTRVGLILSQTGIDELPQLLNVLHGEISFVEALKSLL